MSSLHSQCALLAEPARGDTPTRWRLVERKCGQPSGGATWRILPFGSQQEPVRRGYDGGRGQRAGCQLAEILRQPAEDIERLEDERVHLLVRTAEGDPPDPEADPLGGERQILRSAPTTALAFVLAQR